jgi:molybdopterin/thiamine biosynthesis adenylyltransferase
VSQMYREVEDMEWTNGILKGRTMQSAQAELSIEIDIARPARVLQIGCGAIGSHTVLNVPSTVHHLALCDHDIVTRGNVDIASFSESEVGACKVSALAHRIRRERPALHVTCLNFPVSRISPAMIDAFDIVSVAVDNDIAAYTVSRIVAQSRTQPCILFANCDASSGAGQVRIVNYRANRACVGCNRAHLRWEAPAASPHSCTNGATRATRGAAQFAAALQVSTMTDLLSAADRQQERAGESLIINPCTGHVARARMTFNNKCPAVYHVCLPDSQNMVHLDALHSTLTLRQLLDEVAGRLGQTAIIDLGERWWSAYFSCSSCRKTLRVFRLVDAPPRCACGVTMTPLDGARRLTMVHRNKRYADVTLSDAGFADGDMIAAVSPYGFRFFLLELSSAWANELLSKRAP